MYHLVTTSAFDRQYERLTADVLALVDRQIQRLLADPHHPSLHTHKRQGEDNMWQARVTRNYRLYFSMEGDLITLHRVGPHE